MKLTKILFASANQGKIIEIKNAAQSLTQMEIVSAYDFAQKENKIVPDIIEDADTYLGNAKLKAEGFFKWGTLPCIADDTGLEVAALNGMPGVFSARYAGEPSNSQKNIEKLLSQMSGQKDRRARFYCLLYFKISEDKFLIAEGHLSGLIIDNAQGLGGFGYDSIFLVEKYGKTLAQLKEEGVFVETHRIMAAKNLFQQFLARL